MTFQVVPAHQLSLTQQAEIFSQAFAGYIGGAFTMDAAGLARFICLQGADLCYSRVIRAGGEIVGFGLINRTGNISRLAGMGVVPPARRTGAARHLLEHLLNEARTRNDEAMILEVIEQNPAAYALYQSHGFRQIDYLIGWRKSSGAQKTDAEQFASPEEISLLTACHLGNSIEYPDLSWPVSRHGILKSMAGHAYRIENASVVIGDLQSDATRIHGLFSNSSGDLDWPALKNALAAVLKANPGREFFTPPVFPKKFGEQIFEPLGFAREALTQFLMRYDLR